MTRSLTDTGSRRVARDGGQAPRLAWRIYAWAFVVMLAYAHASILQGNPTGYDVVDAVMSAAAAVGVLSFAHAWRLLSRSFWRAFFVVFLAWELLYELVLCAWLGLGQRDVLPAAPTPLFTSVVAGVIVFALFFPAYLALFKYAFGRNVRWQAP